MYRVPAYILAGGKSSRFGSDKARVILDNEPLILHVRRLLEAFASSITVVADRPDKYADLGLHTLADLNPGLGPLSGLQTALKDLHDDQSWLLLCSCDAIVVKPHWIRQLMTARDREVDAAAFRGQDGKWQPMPALYASRALPRVQDQLAADQRGMQQLLDRLDTARFRTPMDWPPLWQINSPADLAAYRASR